jgi:hypothetical protein
MESVLILGIIKMLMKSVLLRQGGVGNNDGSYFPGAKASEQHDLSSPEVGEVSHLRLCKSQKNYGIKNQCSLSRARLKNSIYISLDG